MQSLQASKVTVTLVCFAFILWNPICELLLLTTGFPGQTTQTSLAPNFLSSFLQRRANVIPTDSDIQWTNWPAFEANTGLTNGGEQSPCALFPKGCCWGLERVSVRSWWDSTLHHQWPKAGQYCNWNFSKAMWMGWGSAAGAQPRHSCPGDRGGRGPSGSRTLPSTGQGLSHIRFNALDRSHTLPLTDLSHLTAKPGISVKKVQNRLWTIKTLAKTKNLNKPN